MQSEFLTYKHLTNYNHKNILHYIKYFSEICALKQQTLKISTDVFKYVYFEYLEKTGCLSDAGVL